MRYRLSFNAQQSLKNIKTYSEKQFGIAQTRLYLQSFQHHFRLLCDNPEIGKQHPDIEERVRAMPCGSHIIFYQITQEQIEIIDILHKNMLPQLHLYD